MVATNMSDINKLIDVIQLLIWGVEYHTQTDNP